jgi:hypothetical protein
MLGLTLPVSSSAEEEASALNVVEFRISVNSVTGVVAAPSAWLPV